MARVIMYHTFSSGFEDKLFPPARKKDVGYVNKFAKADSIDEPIYCKKKIDCTSLKTILLSVTGGSNIAIKKCLIFDIKKVITSPEGCINVKYCQDQLYSLLAEAEHARLPLNNLQKNFSSR